MLKMWSRLLGLLIGVACRIAAGAIHTQVWRLVTGAGDAPQATGQDHGWWEVPVAAGVRALSPEWSKARPIVAQPLGIASSPGTWPGK
jgi:hypothetical protein